MFLSNHILKDPRENFLDRKLFYWMQLHYSRRLFKQTLFQQSRRPHLQVQEAICYTPKTCVMCQLWRAACGKGRPHPQCGLPTFLLIDHKWNFQWLAGTSSAIKSLPNDTYLLTTLPLKLSPWKPWLSPSRGANGMSWWWMLGLWQLVTSALGQTWHHLLVF